ncbi:MAG: hypothetical protein FWD60_00635 [Candidatus Azobacteroides sp.]|nr:hypothetical protein [Candidatus Azobacteroides sp.]
MKKNLFFYLYFCTCLGFISCSEDWKDELVINEVAQKEIQEEYVIPSMVSGMNRFSEILSKAVTENAELRSFLKKEALKTMDNDYDVFYPRSKNEIVSGSAGKSFREILAEYAVNEEELVDIEEQFPLLTIYVPELPSGFNANTWDAKNEIPYVANIILKNDSTSFYYDGEIAGAIASYEIPGCPTLVVKNNERIRLKEKITGSALLRSASYEDAYEFIDEAFDGLNSQPTPLRAATLPGSQLSPVLITAYNEMGVSSPVYWQRDHIYYGMTKQTGSTGYGYFDPRFSEKLVSIKFNNEAYNKMADQPGGTMGDPLMTEKNMLSIAAIQTAHPNYSIGDCLWTEGRFEIRIDLITGSGSTSYKLFNVDPQEIFDVQYTSSGFIKSFIPEIVIGKEYYPNSTIFEKWNLETEGYKWKFIISEVDTQTSITQTGTITSEYATNFGITNGGYQGKIGLNFGASAKRTQTSTYTMTTTQGSDDLGTVELYFSDPVIKSASGNNYTLFSISNEYVEMTVIPVQMY